MRYVFMEKGVETPEDYLKRMLDCTDENGELPIARQIDDVTFCTAESEETASHVENVKLDVSLADYDFLYSFYEEAINDVNAFIEHYSSECQGNLYGNRMVIFARRIRELMKLRAPDIVLRIERCMLMDSIVLYKTNAVGNLYENVK